MTPQPGLMVLHLFWGCAAPPSGLGAHARVDPVDTKTGILRQAIIRGMWEEGMIPDMLSIEFSEVIVVSHEAIATPIAVGVTGTGPMK